MEELVLAKESAINMVAELHRDESKVVTGITRCNPVLMIRNGFMPDDSDGSDLDKILNSPAVIRYLSASKEKRRDPVFKATTNFWMLNGSWDISLSLNMFLRRLRYHPTWIYNTTFKHKQKAIALCSSIPLIFLAPDMLYRKSKRPITDMSLYRRPSNHYVPKSMIKEDELGLYIVLDNHRYYVVPVTRYSEGMSKGLFNTTERPSNTCGFFYYIEPESSTYLLCDETKVRRYFNKTDAYTNMIKNVTRPDDYYIHRMCMSDESVIMDHISGVLPRNLVMSPVELTDYTLGDWDDDNVDDVPRYAGVALGLYSSEDDYDQHICKMGHELDVELIELEAMVGSNGVVKEVLDTRSNSFEFLVYTY